MQLCIRADVRVEQGPGSFRSGALAHLSQLANAQSGAGGELRPAQPQEQDGPAQSN